MQGRYVRAKEESPGAAVWADLQVKVAVVAGFDPGLHALSRLLPGTDLRPRTSVRPIHAAVSGAMHSKFAPRLRPHQLKDFCVRDFGFAGGADWECTSPAMRRSRRSDD